MTVYNTEIAALLNRIADLLEIEGDNPFRIRAYRNAARTVSGLSKNVSDLIKQGTDLTELPGIGEDLASKIQIIVRTGTLPLLRQIEKRTPPILCKMMNIEGLGPKRVSMLYKKLHIRSFHDLDQAIKKGKLRKLRGFGEKTEQRILAGLSHVTQYTQRIRLAEIFPVVDALIAYLKQFREIKKVECAGSVRRRKETIGD